jgi:hypothetical protein
MYFSEKNYGINLVNFLTNFGIFLGQLVHFFDIWYIIPKKILATMVNTVSGHRKNALCRDSASRRYVTKLEQSTS